MTATEDRRTLFAAQTPQGFRFPQILSAHLRAGRMPQEFTDDAAIAEWAGLTVALTAGSTTNIKITHPEDFARAERLLHGGRTMETRVGTGFDVHPFDEGNAGGWAASRSRTLHKLKGHFDAGRGAACADRRHLRGAGEGDIGKHFSALRSAMEGRGLVDLPGAMRLGWWPSAAGGSSTST